MILCINYEVFRHTRVKSLFDPYSYQIFLEDHVDRDENPDYIEFPIVTRMMSMKAYVDNLSNKQMRSSFAGCTDKEFWDLFWDTFDDGGEILCDFERFEYNYTLKIIMEWCDENNIPYYINKSDSFLLKLLS